MSEPTRKLVARVPVSLFERIEARRLLAAHAGWSKTRTDVVLEALALGLDMIDDFERKSAPDGEIEAIRTIVASHGVDVDGASEDFLRGYFESLARRAVDAPEVELDFEAAEPLTLTTPEPVQA